MLWIATEENEDEERSSPASYAKSLCRRHWYRKRSSTTLLSHFIFPDTIIGGVQHLYSSGVPVNHRFTINPFGRLDAGFDSYSSKVVGRK